jgi:hypothetical protein
MIAAVIGTVEGHGHITEADHGDDDHSQNGD